MRWIFHIENPVMHYIIKLFDCMCLSALWLVFSLPVITMGAASTALFVTVHHYLRKEEGHLWQTFWRAFRENWKRSTLVWLAALLVLVLLALDVLVFRTMAIRGDALGELYWLVLLICCIAVTWVAYLFAYAARFHGSVKDVLRFSFLLMAGHPIRALGVFLPVAGGCLLIAMAPGLVFILPTAMCWICSITAEKVFLLHLRPEDAEKQKDMLQEQ